MRSKRTFEGEVSIMDQLFISWAFRPESFHFDLVIKDLLPPKIKGQLRQELIARALSGDQLEEIPDGLCMSSFDNESRQLLGSIHPHLMGGEYLPDRGLCEVEIARITLNSTTLDVTCVYASPHSEGVLYKVVDEYGGETLSGEIEMTTSGPISLKHLVEFFVAGWDLRSCLECNFHNWGYEADAVHDFVYSISSDYYPEFGAAVRHTIDEWLEEYREDHPQEDE